MQKTLKLNKWDDSYPMNQSLRQKYPRSISNDIRQRYLLQNRLIGPQPHFIHKSLSIWADDLRSALKEIYREDRKPKCADQIAKIFNQAAMIFMACENYTYAREICYSQIQMFTNWSKKTNNNHLLKNVFQPWVHLIQINRLEGNIYDAFEKLNTLNFSNQSEYIMGENKVLTQSLYDALHQDPVLYNQVLMQSIIEKIKLCFESKQYMKLIAFLENNRIMGAGANEIIVREARAIAYANNGMIHKAFSILMCGNPLLTLRAFELRLSLGIDYSVPNTLNSLYESSLQLMKSNNVTINHIVSILHTVLVMKMAGMIEKAVKLAYCCLEAAVRIGDEVLKAESLIMLYDLLYSSEGKRIIEDLMVTHYFNTQYAMVRKKMLHSFKDLKYVENNHDHDDMTPLFEDLLAFDVYL